MWRADIPSTTVTPSGLQRPLPRMGASSLRTQEPQLMRSPGEPLQINQRSFGCMIELAVIGHRPRARSSSDAWRGSVEITVLPRTSRRQLSPALTSAAPLQHCFVPAILWFRTSSRLDSEPPFRTAPISVTLRDLRPSQDRSYPQPRQCRTDLIRETNQHETKSFQRRPRVYRHAAAETLSDSEYPRSA
jgi:hypothetical protein